MANISVQIQSILYHNDASALEKAICNVENAEIGRASCRERV